MFNKRHFRALALACAVSFVFSFLGIGQSATDATGGTTSPVAAFTSATAAVDHASDNVQMTPTEDGGHHDADVLQQILLALMLILLLAKVGGDLFERIGQPAVLGELIFGMVLGNLSLFHLDILSGPVGRIFHQPEVNHFVTMLAELGVILLLFQVGLESTVREMVSVGLSSLVVAVLGVIAPIGLGFLVGQAFLPHEPWTVHLFLGAVLAATSVGITARVLTDLGKMHLRESKVILGAAVIDDILGLVVLAAVQGIVAATNAGQSISLVSIGWLVLKAVLFFVIAIVLGVLVSRRLYVWATYLRGKGVLLTITLIWCFLIAYLSALIGLAPIVGAFAAGLVLEEATFSNWHGRDEQLEKILKPVCDFMVPVFFVHMGMRVDLSVFGQVNILGFAAVLTLAAIVGKQICSLGVMERGLNRLVVGLGMIPRGEVGLIVASIGASMRTSEGHPVISPDTFSATVIMVVLTTMITPPVLKWALNRKAAPPSGR